jgi:lipopolysaccharide export system permease protein
MKILRNYILRECIAPFFLTITVLLSLFLLINIVQLANLVINKGVGFGIIGELLFLSLPIPLGYMLPVSCLFAVITTFSRLSTDNEILAIRASGIYLKNLLMPIILIGVILSLLCIILNEQAIPYSYHARRKLIKNLGTENPTAFMEPGVFIKAFEGYIMFFYDKEDNLLKNIRIYQPQPDGKPTRTIVAKQGEFSAVPNEEKIKIKLMDGTSDEPDYEKPGDFYKLNFKNYFMTFDLSKKKHKIEKKPNSMTPDELKAEIEKYHRLFIDPAPLVAEYHRKISWSFATLIFILLSFPLSVATHHRTKAANLFWAFVIVTVYYVLSTACFTLSSQGTTPPALTMWIPNMIGGFIALITNYQLYNS